MPRNLKKNKFICNIIETCNTNQHYQIQEVERSKHSTSPDKWTQICESQIKKYMLELFLKSWHNGKEGCYCISLGVCAHKPIKLYTYIKDVYIIGTFNDYSITML